MAAAARGVRTMVGILAVSYVDKNKRRRDGQNKEDKSGGMYGPLVRPPRASKDGP